MAQVRFSEVAMSVSAAERLIQKFGVAHGIRVEARYDVLCGRTEWKVRVNGAVAGPFEDYAAMEAACAVMVGEA